MATYRQVMVCMWSDKDFELYNPDQKLLFIYLCTNPLTRESGIYQATLKTISDNTGISRNRLPTLLKGLKNVLYDAEKEIVFVKNFHRFNGQGGKPENIKLSIMADVIKYNTPLWFEFLKTYNYIDNEIKDLISNTISNTNSNTNTIEGITNPSATVGKKPIVQEVIDIPKHLAEIWPMFVEHRKAKKSPLTNQAIKLILKKLSKFTPDDQVKMLERSIENGWTGIFELDKKTTAPKSRLNIAGTNYRDGL